MKRLTLTGLMMILSLMYLTPLHAHFGMVIPSDTMVMADEKRTIDITLSFSHPFEQIGMSLEKPDRFAVTANGKGQDLTQQLTKTKVMGHPAWSSEYAVKRPGAYIFTMTPSPYWEPSEDSYIVHYTKTIVAAFGDDTGWDAEVGLKTEIVPLSRPFGLYAGNVFQGVVKVAGRPVSHAMVEVEYYNQGTAIDPANDFMITQTIKADANGVFSYVAPVPGWWGFAALTESDEKMSHNGVDKSVELGAVIWVKFEPWKAK